MAPASRLGQAEAEAHVAVAHLGRRQRSVENADLVNGAVYITFADAVVPVAHLRVATLMGGGRARHHLLRTLLAVDEQRGCRRCVWRPRDATLSGVLATGSSPTARRRYRQYRTETGPPPSGRGRHVTEEQTILIAGAAHQHRAMRLSLQVSGRIQPSIVQLLPMSNAGTVTLPVLPFKRETPVRPHPPCQSRRCWLHRDGYRRCRVHCLLPPICQGIGLRLP